MEIYDVSYTTASGVYQLKFSTWTDNIGAGALELHGGAVINGVQTVTQWIFDSDGTHTEHSAGTFGVVNGKLRFTDAADYFLREVTADDGVGGVVASNQKIAYCIVDSSTATNPPPGTSGTPTYGYVYPQCGQIMGISVGWADIYPSYFSTQNIALTGVTSGTYWLENIADPLNRLQESNETNNTTRMKVTFTTSYAPHINVVGNGQTISNNDVTPAVADGTDFGYVDVSNGSVTHTFTVENTGTGTLSMPGVPKVQITGSSDFVVTTAPVSPVPSGATTTFQITFNPSALGVRNASVIISNNDANGSSYSFGIRGNTDADNDGLPDGWEVANNVSDPALDDDGDGASNYSEFIAGTSPRNGSSTFRIASVTCGSTGCDVAFDSLAGRAYQLDYRDSFSDGWTMLGQRTGTGGRIVVNDASAAGIPQRFYKLTVGF